MYTIVHNSVSIYFSKLLGMIDHCSLVVVSVIKEFMKS